MGNDFLIKHKAVIDFHKRVLELNSEGEPVRINFERVIDAVRISGVRAVSYTHLDVYKRQDPARSKLKGKWEL